jgi:hypothetical protein
VVVKGGCLVFAPAGEGLASVAHDWLKQHADGIDPQWTALSLKRFTPTPNVHLHLLRARADAYLIIHTEGFGRGSKPVARGATAVDTWCLQPLDERILKSVRDDMDKAGKCWRHGPVETLAKPRFSFPTGRRYTKVRTTTQESACALDSGGAITCCGNTSLALNGSYLDLDTAGSSMCAVAKSGAADCWNLRSGSKELTLPGSFSSVSARTNGACGLTPAGAIVCGGSDTGTPPPDGQFRAVSAPSSCAIQNDRELVCWSTGKAERIGSGPWLQIATERDRPSEACGLHEGGAPWCWQISSPVASLKPAPTRLTFSQLASASGTRCGTAGTAGGCNLQCWRGDSGLGSTGVAPCLADVSLGSPSCAVTSEGDVRCWGFDRWSNDLGLGGH